MGDLGDRGAGANAVRTGRPAAGIVNVFRNWCVAAGLLACSVHGLRNAAKVRLIEAGCTSPEADAVTGHDSICVPEIYARERDRAKQADAAMGKLIGEGDEMADNVQIDNPWRNNGQQRRLTH